MGGANERKRDKDVHHRAAQPIAAPPRDQLTLLHRRNARTGCGD
jgi:hypothetical protein